MSVSLLSLPKTITFNPANSVQRRQMEEERGEEKTAQLERQLGWD
jgi:hypothetical protein